MEEKKKWFGRGIYNSKDLPIRALDCFIAAMVVVAAALVFWFATQGGYTITFDSQGGNEIDSQRLKHGEYAARPEVPEKPGYVLAGWVTSLDESLAEEWDFVVDTIEDDLTLYAVWKPAVITVKFDLDGGTLESGERVPDIEVTYGEAYGELPVPKKEGYTFDGWVYSGAVITADSKVSTTGEHILTARWI